MKKNDGTALKPGIFKNISLFHTHRKGTERPYILSIKEGITGIEHWADLRWVNLHAYIKLTPMTRRVTILGDSQEVEQDV